MSDTAAFLAGCAVTGVAVMFLMRNDFAVSQPRSPQPLQPLSPTPDLQATPVPASPLDDGRGIRMEAELDQQQDLARTLSDELKRQQDQTEDLKGLVEKQQDQIEDQQSEADELKRQLERQQQDTETLIAQLQEQQRLLDKVSDQPVRSTLPIEPSTKIETIMVGAVGVILLVIVIGGGGLIVVGLIVIVLSSRRRHTRTVHIVHPFPAPYATFPEQPLLPTRPRTRPAKQIDVEYYNDGDSDYG
ncbi:MAG: hypothetical protein HC865_00945 [Cyanobacteria bacterium RU_5_0]|nr:hypothetical protein [Cyanobacteria bacterium RU_5_0]